MPSQGILPFIPIRKLDLDLQIQIKEAQLTSLRDFRTTLLKLQSIQESRWSQVRGA